ncbi:MAG: hypothetical protein CBARDMAM_2272 [uncultured Caballeronia sp.]|nr:MAG: hypothetical protein CBARDMAM_2272 [uncultured Caballeronia sp.]
MKSGSISINTQGFAKAGGVRAVSGLARTRLRQAWLLVLPAVAMLATITGWPLARHLI